MNSLEINKDIIQTLKHSKNITELINLVDSLSNNVIPDDLTNEVCALIEIEDKGFRNNLNYLLTYNQSPDIPHYLVRFISSENISTRNLAGEILLKRGSSSIPSFISYLKHADHDDRKFIIDILGLIGDKVVVPSIIEVLEKEENENVILACIEAFGNLRAEEAFQPLIKLYTLNELYRPSIIEAFGKAELSESLEFLLSVYEEEDSLVQYSIIETLGQIGDEQTFYFLVGELNKSEGAILVPIINSLCNLKAKFSLDIPFEENTKTVLLSVLNEDDTEVKSNAARLLTAFDDKDLINVYLKLYGDDYEIDEIVKEKLFEIKEELYSKLSEVISEEPQNLSSLLYLTKELLDLFPDMSLQEKRNLISTVSSKLNYPEEEVRRLCMEILFMLDVESAFLFMDSMSDDVSIWNKLRLIELLEPMNVPVVNQYLENLSKDNDEMVKTCAVTSLLNRTNSLSN